MKQKNEYWFVKYIEELTAKQNIDTQSYRNLLERHKYTLEIMQNNLKVLERR